MKVVAVKKEIDAQREKVWQVLADFPNIFTWNSGVKKSHCSNGIEQGVGAERLCVVSGGTLTELVQKWDVNNEIVIDVHTLTGFPVKNVLSFFKLSGDSKTTVEIEFQFYPKGIGFILSPLLKIAFKKSIKNIISDLEIAAKLIA